jgi:small-conductance mechanosensitive channel
MASRLKYVLKRILLACFIAAIITLAVIIWNRAPGTVTVTVALIGASVVVFKDTLTNIIAGLMFIWDGSFRRGDIIRLDPSLAKSLPEPYGVVTSLNLQHVVIHERHGMQILIPNSHLATTTVWRWHPNQGNLALLLQLHLAPGSNFEQAKILFLDACRQCPRVLQSPWPMVRLVGLKDGQAIIVLRFWIADPQNGISSVYSEIIERIAQESEASNIKLQEALY